MAACVLLGFAHHHMRDASSVLVCWSRLPVEQRRRRWSLCLRLACGLPSAVGTRPALAVAAHAPGAELRKVRTPESHAAIAICRLDP